MAGMKGLEPSHASGLTSQRANQLHYTPIKKWQSDRESNPTLRIWSPGHHHVYHRFIKQMTGARLELATLSL